MATRIARGTDQVPNERRETSTHVVVEKVVEVVVEPRVVQVIELPDADSVALPDLEVRPSDVEAIASVPVMSSRARRASQAYLAEDVPPRKPLVIA